MWRRDRHTFVCNVCFIFSGVISIAEMDRNRSSRPPFRQHNTNASANFNAEERELREALDNLSTPWQRAASASRQTQRREETAHSTQRRRATQQLVSSPQFTDQIAEQEWQDLLSAITRTGRSVPVQVEEQAEQLNAPFFPAPRRQLPQFEEDALYFAPHVLPKKVASQIDATNADYTCEQSSEWAKRNCASCSNVVTLEAFTPEQERSLASIKLFNEDTKQFAPLGECVSVEDVKDMLRSDIGNPSPQYVYSLYSLKPNTQHLSESELRRGMGTEPSQRTVFKLVLGNATLFVTAGSMIHLLRSKTPATLYAVPLFGGKPRRVGNVMGQLLGVGTNHGQIPGYKIYKLYSAETLVHSKSATVDEFDFDPPSFVIGKMTELYCLLDGCGASYAQTVIDNLIRSVLAEVPVIHQA